MSRAAAPFAAASSIVKFLSNLGLAVQTQRRLDSMERTLASRLAQRPGDCGLIRVNAWSNILNGETQIGEPVFLGVSRYPVNLIVEEEVRRAVTGVVEPKPYGREWCFDGTKAFFMCYTKTAKESYRRGLVPYQRAIDLINDKGQALIRKAYEHAYLVQRFPGAKSWWCAYDKQNHASLNDCQHLEVGGAWSTRSPTTQRLSQPKAGKSLTEALAEPY